MKLGIVVVYLVSEDNEQLLDLHLSQIEKHTRVPYTIYGSINRLLPRFRQKLEQHPKVKVCECPTTDLRGTEEHAFYLNHLVRIALQDGASHVVTLHVDSFPIRSGWAKRLAGYLSDSCVLVAIMQHERFCRRPDTSCLLFERGFYLEYHPAFLLSEAERSSAKYERYRKEFRHPLDSGVGYGFKIYSEGLCWYPLLRSNKGANHHTLGSVYDDLIFHLGGAVRLRDTGTKNASVLSKYAFALFVHRVTHVVKPIIPDRVRNYFRVYSMRIHRPVLEHIRAQLLEDPESYLNYLRTGKR